MYKKQTLYESVAVPSSVHSYSMAIEFMKNWFITKFPKDFFKTINIDQRHILDSFAKLDISETLTSPKPSLAITPQIQLDYNRENVDTYESGSALFTRRTKLDQAFFRDYDKNLFLTLMQKQLEINFNFKIRVSTKAMQLDLFEYIKNSFRIGTTQGIESDVEMHIPYGVMLELAKDADFQVTEDNTIVDVISFVNYINLHSFIPVLFRFRKINGRYEFFLRIPEMYIHINNTENLSADDGERQGMLYNNFIIEMNSVLKYPAPMLYMYHSREEHQYLSYGVIEDYTFILNRIKFQEIPNNNEKNWNKYINTEYVDEDCRDQILTIDFKEFFTGPLRTVIEYNNSIAIASDLCIDIKLWNNDDPIPIKIDWVNMTLTTKIPVHNIVTYMAVYVNMDYMNTYEVEINKMS